ncbi:hypothetical protein J437_LFUL014642 [Ladona fulva]|uniref:Endonuclease/exonuclease/phosphatase domain-containing protein n=1 Tax=Ladona fulva TaxID=123851 RepID=A0A8K0P8D3_LADFU|nr:hypothetical protein J437_LFUL014642 [Ladona fulva]
MERRKQKLNWMERGLPRGTFQPDSFEAEHVPGAPAIMAGDLNAKHPDWGSLNSNATGKKLRQWAAVNTSLACKKLQDSRPAAEKSRQRQLGCISPGTPSPTDTAAKEPDHSSNPGQGDHFEAAFSPNLGLNLPSTIEGHQSPESEDPPEVHPVDIAATLHRVRPRKTPGPDSIENEVLKHLLYSYPLDCSHNQGHHLHWALSHPLEVGQDNCSPQEWQKPVFSQQLTLYLMGLGKS